MTEAIFTIIGFSFGAGVVYLLTKDERKASRQIINDLLTMTYQRLGYTRKPNTELAPESEPVLTPVKPDMVTSIPITLEDMRAQAIQIDWEAQGRPTAPAHP